MTVHRCQFLKFYRSAVKKMLFVVVLLTLMGNLPLNCKGQEFDRDARRLFGGYRITPIYCKASRAARYNRGNTICMFNHDCTQRGGEVVGSCMDGFLFGACCQLKSDSQSHIPKGPGVVIPGYVDYSESEAEGDEYDNFDQLDSWHNSFKPVVTPGYRPSDKYSVFTATASTTEPNFSTESVQAEIISEGLSQITNTLLNTPPKDNNLIYSKPEKTDTLSTIDHAGADTILLHKNGSEVDDIVRPSDFNIQISSMQTKPTISPSTTFQSPPSFTVSTHKPIFKPIFKPKPAIKTTSENPSTENYVMISTVTKETQKITELSSIDSIILMLNESTPSMKEDLSSSATLDMIETKSSPITASTPVYHSGVYPINHITTGHYVTLKPSSYPNNEYISNSASVTSKPSFTSKKPSYGIIYTTPNVISQDNKPTSVKPQLSSPKPSQSTSQAIEAFNRYPTDPGEFGQTVTTFTYVSSTTTKPTPTTRKPPSTSYVSVVKPSRKPITYSTNTDSTYDVALDSFSSATPTVILLNNLQTTKPDSSEDKEPEFVEISQEPFKKPVSQITVNNHIESTNNIFMGKPPQAFERPASPTVVITPKPSPNTTPYPIKSSTKPISISTMDVSNFDTYTEFYSATTLKPELQTSVDDLNNFPPVRNPMLNTTGTNTIVLDTNVSDNELDSLHEVEFTTPTWHEDDKLNEKMNLFVNKIVGSLQGTFQELHDIVILDKKPNTTIIKDTKTTTLKPTRKTPATTRRPITTTKKPSRITTTRKTPIRTTKRPTKLTTAVRRPTTTTTLQTTTKKSVTTTKKPKPTKKATSTTVTPSTTTELYDEITTESYTEQIVNYNDKNLCGVRPLMKSGRIVGGKNASFGEWPWQVLIRESSWLGLFTKNKCGGVLITNRFVTTAAHCQPGFMGSLVAVFGENDISTNLEPRRPVTKNVRRIIPHPKYDAATFENDLALLELDSPIKYEPHIVPICMPPDDADFTNRMATVTGWGRLKYGGGVPAILQEVQVPVMENSHCQYMFQTAGHAKKILDSFICAGYSNGKKDSCEGDSGGPLVVRNDDGRWVLVGTVSHGIKCAARFLPGVYMRTTYYKPWYRSVTGVK